MRAQHAAVLEQQSRQLARDAAGALQANAQTLALSPSWNPAVRLQVDLLGDHGRRWPEAQQLIEHALAQRDGFDDADLIGLLAWVPTVVRQRREIARLKRAAEKQAAIAALAATPPATAVALPPAPSPTDVHGI